MSQDFNPQPPDRYPQESGYPLEQPKSDLPKLKPEPASGRRQVPILGTFVAWLRVLIHPGVDTFAAEAAYANWGAVILGVIVESISTFLYVFALTLHTSTVVSTLGELLRLTFVTMVIIVITFLFRSAVLYVIARRTQSGDGNFKVQTYLYSLSYFPISAIAAVLGSVVISADAQLNLFTCVAAIGITALGIYSLALTYMMLRAAHHMDSSGAGFTMVYGFAITFVVSVVVGLLYHYTFSSIMQLTAGFVTG